MTRTICLIVTLLLATVSVAERPTAMRLFPENTVLFVRVPDATESSRNFKKTLLGRMLEEPELAPLAENLYGRASDALRSNIADETDGEVEVNLTSLLSLMRGELAFGLVHRQNQHMAVLALVDTLGSVELEEGEGLYRPDEFVELMKSLAKNEGVTIAEEDLGGYTATVFRPGDNQENQFGLVLRDDVLLLSNDRDLLVSALVKWDGGALPEGADRFDGTLAENPAFATALRECIEERVGGDATPPGLIGYVDPVGLLRAGAQKNMGLRIALAVFPTLGLDGVEGIAGATWVDVGGWESLMRWHLLLDNPRSGVLRIVRLQACDTKPSDAVTADTLTYMVGSIDLADALDKAGQLHDLIRGEGKFAENIEAPAEGFLGVSLRDILALTTGRIESVDGFSDSIEGETPQVSAEKLALLELNDPETAKVVLRKILDKFGDRFVWESHHGVEYARVKMDPFNPPDDMDLEQQERIRRLRDGAPRPGFAVVGDQLVISQSYRLLRKSIEAHVGERERLADALEFKLVHSRVERLSRSSGPSEGTILFYSNPAEQYRRWAIGYQSEEGRKHFDALAGVFPPFRVLRDALAETGMPAEETLMKYAAPSGGVLYDTANGFRWVGFQFDREE